MRARDIAVVVPVHNDPQGLARLLPQLKPFNFGQTVLVDDGSSPPVAARGVLRRSDIATGPGSARDLGLAQVKKPYVLFLDSDDQLLAPFRQLLRDLQNQPFDICLFQHDEGAGHLPPHDQEIWSALRLGIQAVQQVPLAALPSLAQVQNYPWNRLYRTAFLRAHQIRHGATFLHEDIRPHWHAFSRAQKVLVSDHICVLHHPGRLTAIGDKRRLQYRDALAETAPLLPDGDWRRSFAGFAANLHQWAMTQMSPAPPIISRAPLRLKPVGPHRAFMPPAYAALRPYWGDRIAITTDGPFDLQLIAHPHDAQMVVPKPTLLLSEEPFWDLLHNPHPDMLDVTLPGAIGALSVAQITHANSDVYAPDGLPYFPLTDHGFEQTYRQLFARNAKRSAQDWLDLWAQAKWHFAFAIAHRPEAFNDIAHSGLRGLSARRTGLALHHRGPRTVIFGTGWAGAGQRDSAWHQTKIARLDGRARVISAIENTLHPHYLSEKLFDAMACGALPLVIAPPDHAAHRLGLPPSVLCDPGMTPDATLGLARDYSRAQQRLAALWRDPARIAAARARFAARIGAQILARA